MSEARDAVESDSSSRPELRVWLLVVGMFAGVGALVATTGAAAPVVDLPLPVPVVVVGFVLGELAMVRLHFRTEAHEFNLIDAPLVFALFTISPVWTVASCMTAVAVVRAVRRQQLLKAAFNIALAGVEASIAVTVARGLAPTSATEVGPRLWIAAILGIGIATAVSAALVHLVIVVTEGPQHLNRPIRSFVPSLAITVATVSVALGAFTVASSNPIAGVLWIAPLGVVFIGYRAYLAHLEESGRLAFIARFTTAMASSHDAESSLHTLLRHVCDEVGAASAEAIVFTDDHVRTEPTVARLARDRFTLQRDPDSAAMEEARLYAAGCSDGEIVAEAASNPLLSAYLVGAGFSDAIVVPLVHDGQPLGLLTVGNRSGDVARWRSDDHELLVAVAHSTSVILYSGRLTKALDAAVTVGARLLDEARHDPLTTLANRRGLETAVETAADNDDSVAAIYLDLNDFKAINDTHGHATGDAVLRTIGQRIHGMTRPGELAARVGGDEFVVLLSPAPDDTTVESIAGRLSQTIAEPITVGDLVIETSASIGIGRGVPGAEAASLFAHADAAMYEAKQSRRGDCVITLP